MKEFCSNCKTRECEYIEVVRFIDYYNRMNKKKYKLQECPDKDKKDYTCDLVYADKNDKLYIEVKRVEYGFGKVKKANPSLAGHNGQIRIMELIDEVINKLANSEEYKDFTVNIPFVQFGKKEFEPFKKDLNKFLKKQTIVGCKKFSFTYKYKSSKNQIKIEFTRKDIDLINLEISTNIDEGRNINDCRTIYSLEIKGNKGNKDNIELGDIFKNIMDTSLNELLAANIEKTKEIKFPSNAQNKILLNILKVQPVYEPFVHLLIKKLISDKEGGNFKSVQSSITEGYLLYFDEDFYNTEKSNTVYKHYKNALVVLPLWGAKDNSCTINYEKVEQIGTV